MSTLSIKSPHEEAYKSLMKGLEALDLPSAFVPSDLVLIGDDAFPLAMNSGGQVVMAASLYGHGRIVVLGHEGYLQAFPALVENAVSWLRGEGSDGTVGVHEGSKAVADNLHKSGFQTKLLGAFGKDLKVSAYVTDAYSVGNDVKALVAFLKAGGGVLIAGQAWEWAKEHPRENTLLKFEGNKVSSVGGIYFSMTQASVEKIPISPEIPQSMATAIGSDFEDDLEFLLQGVPEFDLQGGALASEIMVHSSLAFPIGTTKKGRAFLAGAYYGQGRVIVVSHEGFLAHKTLAPFWRNALHWLDEGRNGTVGIYYNSAFENLQKSGLNCVETGLREDLSVFVCKLSYNQDLEKIQKFVAEGGSLLIGGHCWYWALVNPKKNALTDFMGNQLLNKMGLTVLPSIIRGGLYKAMLPSQAAKDMYHFRNLLRRFTAHVTTGEELCQSDVAHFKRLSKDSANFLAMEAHGRPFYTNILSTLDRIMRTCGLPQMSEKCPAKTAKDHLLLRMAPKLYKFTQDPDGLFPYLIKYNPTLPVVHNSKIKINANTKDLEDWISTGLYLSPGMKTNISVPKEIVDRGWQIQIGCHTDHLKHAELLRANCVHEHFPVNAEMIRVCNLWGGLIYMIPPPHTRVEDLELTVEMAVAAPYYISGVTTLSDWETLRNAPAPWAELEFENIILTVQSNVIRDLDRPDELGAMWDRIMRGVAELAALPKKFARKERFVTDVQISYGWMHAGYPIMAHNVCGVDLVNIQFIKEKGFWGPVHELGHNQQRSCWEFPSHTTECTCNLWSMYVHEEVLGMEREKAHPCLIPENRNTRKKQYVEEGRNLECWNMWVALETYIQLQEMFGWDAFKKVFAMYHQMSNFPTDNKAKMNLYVETFSQAVGKNLSAFFKSWGWPVEAATEEKLSKLPPWSDHPMVQFD